MPNHKIPTFSKKAIFNEMIIYNNTTNKFANKVCPKIYLGKKEAGNQIGLAFNYVQIIIQLLKN